MMDGEQIRIEEKAHFYIKDKKYAERYELEKKKQGYKTELIAVQPKGFIVKSYMQLSL